MVLETDGNSNITQQGGVVTDIEIAELGEGYLSDDLIEVYRGDGNATFTVALGLMFVSARNVTGLEDQVTSLMVNTGLEGLVTVNHRKCWLLTSLREMILMMKREARFLLK